MEVGTWRYICFLLFLERLAIIESRTDIYYYSCTTCLFSIASVPCTHSLIPHITRTHIVDASFPMHHIDIRPDSATFGQYEAVVLSGENQKQFFVPRGFAHGFLVLSETATFFYKCDNFYNKESEGGIIFNDETINIDWQFPISELIISEKDKVQPTIENAKMAW